MLHFLKNIQIIFKNCLIRAEQVCPCQGLHSLQASTWCPFHSSKSFAHLWTFDLGTAAFDLKALRPLEDTVFLLTSRYVVSYLSSQHQEPLQLPFHPNTMAYEQTSYPGFSESLGTISLLLFASQIVFF